MITVLGAGNWGTTAFRVMHGVDAIGGDGFRPIEDPP